MTKKTEPDKKETVFKTVTGLESANKNINNTLQRQFLRRLGILGFILLLIISGGAYLLWPNSSPEKREKRLSQQDQPIKKGALLPVVSPRPMDVYAQAFTPIPPGNAAISFIILGTGQFPDLTQQAVDVLPKEITFAISPLIPQAKEWVEKARLKQHEVMLNLGLQPDNYPSNDPGPHTLLTHLHKDENLRRFKWALQQVPMVVGVVHETGNFFTTLDESLRPLIQEIRRSGLFFLDTLVSPYSLVSKISKEEESPYATIHFFCGENPFVIEKELQNLENLARQKGHVIVVASLSPTLLKNLTSWSATLKDKNISLLPVAALFKLKILTDTTGPDAKKTGS